MTLLFLQEELTDAMKTGNTLKRDMLRGVIAAIKKAAIDERCEADEAMVDRILLKEAKTLQEQIDTCPRYSRRAEERVYSSLCLLKCLSAPAYE